MTNMQYLSSGRIKWRSDSRLRHDMVSIDKMSILYAPLDPQKRRRLLGKVKNLSDGTRNVRIGSAHSLLVGWDNASWQRINEKFLEALPPEATRELAAATLGWRRDFSQPPEIYLEKQIAALT